LLGKKGDMFNTRGGEKEDGIEKGGRTVQQQHQFLLNIRGRARVQKKGNNLSSGSFSEKIQIEGNVQRISEALLRGGNLEGGRRRIGKQSSDRGHFSGKRAVEKRGGKGAPAVPSRSSCQEVGGARHFGKGRKERKKRGVKILVKSVEKERNEHRRKDRKRTGKYDPLPLFERALKETLEGGGNQI